jgi:hypothetical protein
MFASPNVEPVILHSWNTATNKFAPSNLELVKAVLLWLDEFKELL